MAFEAAAAAALSAPLWITDSSFGALGEPLPLCSPPEVVDRRRRQRQGGCNNKSTISRPCVGPPRVKESFAGEELPSSLSLSSSSSGGSRMDVDMPIPRREAALQVASAARRSLVASGLAFCASTLVKESPAGAAETKPRPQFYDLDGSGGVKALDIREGTGATPHVGDKVAIHYYARLAAKQGWRFDSSYEHKDQSGAPEPFVFVIGDGTVIAGLGSALLSMKEGGVRRVIIPPSQGYQNTVQGPVPPNFSDRQRLYTTIFNPTRLANGEGSTLGTLVFDIELLGIRPN